VCAPPDPEEREGAVTVPVLELLPAVVLLPEPPVAVFVVPVVPAVLPVVAVGLPAVSA
jgi:hypothetical protein